MTVICTVAARLRVEGATAAQYDRLYTRALRTSPEYTKAIRSGCLPWRRPEEHIAFARRDGDAIELSRGLMRVVREEIPGVRIVDARRSLVHGFTFSRALRPEQQACVDAIVRGQQGGIVGPCGSGKSSIILGGVAACEQAALVVVPSLPILAQFDRDAFDLMGVRASVIGDGRREFGPLMLATMASLRDPELRAEAFKHAGAIFCDEVHGITGPETRAIVDECPAKIRVGGTATWPTDERNGILDALFGRILHRLEVPSLVTSGRLTRPEYRQIRTDFAASDTNDFASLVNATAADADRNELVVRTGVQHCGPNALGLVLTGRIAHAETLSAMFRDAGHRAEALTGNTRTADRERILTAARAGQLDILCATSLADEGLDVPNIARVLLVAPQKAGGRFVQRIGRSMRPSPLKPTSIIFDFVDVNAGLLAYQARGRRAAFHALFQEAA